MQICYFICVFIQYLSMIMHNYLSHELNLTRPLCALMCALRAPYKPLRPPYVCLTCPLCPLHTPYVHLTCPCNAGPCQYSDWLSPYTPLQCRSCQDSDWLRVPTTANQITGIKYPH